MAFSCSSVDPRLSYWSSPVAWLLLVLGCAARNSHLMSRTSLSLMAFSEAGRNQSRNYLGVA